MSTPEEIVRDARSRRMFNLPIRRCIRKGDEQQAINCISQLDDAMVYFHDDRVSYLMYQVIEYDLVELARALIESKPIVLFIGDVIHHAAFHGSDEMIILLVRSLYTHVSYQNTYGERTPEVQRFKRAKLI